MQTELVSKTRQHEPTKDLVESLPVENRNQLYNNGIVQHHKPLNWEDVQGLSWLFINDKVI